MSPAQNALRALLPFALFAVAHRVDEAVGLLLHASVGLQDFVLEALGLLDLSSLAAAIAVATGVGALAWISLAGLRGLREPGLAASLEREATLFHPLYLKPLVSLAALAALHLDSRYPYASTLPVALTQDWAIAVDLAILGALAAVRGPWPALPAPSAAGMFFMAFLAYALLAPPGAREWEGHPGNEPKYLRMAVALSHSLSLDVEEVSAVEDQARPMEALTPRPLGVSLSVAARRILGESVDMVRALLRGPRAVGIGAIRASRLARQTVQGKDGGTYHVLAPGPSVLLAPFLRIDRAINRHLGTPGRLGVTLLAWNAVAAVLASALFVLLRSATGRPGLSALLAGSFALFPPYVFYSFQFYPEMLGALVLAVVLRILHFTPTWTSRTPWVLGLGLAVLPWLHQKFLPVWGLLVLVAFVSAVDRRVTLRQLLGLLVPQGVSLYLTALYNFAITGSVRPDALFLAWGPGGVASARVGEGALGLLLDARYGLLPWVPLYLLAAGGAAVGGPEGWRVKAMVPAAGIYYVTVAAADNWSGSVCNLGRYIMPATPVLAAFVALGLAACRGRRGVLTLGLVLGAWSALLALALWRDPRAANDAALLLETSVFADGNVYVPNLFFRSWNYAAAGHAVRVGAWLLAAALGAVWVRRALRGRGGRSPVGLLVGLLAATLGAGLVLERWPSPRRAPRFPGPSGSPGGRWRTSRARPSSRARSPAPGPGPWTSWSRPGIPSILCPSMLRGRASCGSPARAHPSSWPPAGPPACRSGCGS